MNNVCGDCIFYTGEECDGKLEGQERYQDSDACDGFEELIEAES